MPHMGQSRRCAGVTGTSALPSIADIQADVGLRREGPGADMVVKFAGLKAE